MKTSLKKIFYGLCLIFVYLLFPEDAKAWGPGAHMSYALHALKHIQQLAPSIAVLLQAHPQAFLYGTVAADIILGKKYAGDLYHCHHWDVALPLLKKTKTTEERAFIYGYLGHLAVDTVAHNFYVPYKIIFSYQSLTKRHTYWEMRFDERIDPKVWESIADIAGRDFAHLDQFLEKNLKKALFKFSTNKKIFDSLLLLQRMKKWRQASSIMAKRSAYALPDSEVRSFRRLCCEVLVEFLQDPDNARVLQADPSGNLKLLYAKEMVKDLRSKRRRKSLNAEQADDLIADIKKKLRQSLYQPGELPRLG